MEETLGFLREAVAVTGPDPFPSELLDRFQELVQRGWGVVYEEMDQAEHQVFWDASTGGREREPSRPEDELDRAYWRLRHQDPLCGYQQRTGDLTAHQLSDFVTRRQWHRSDLYAEYHRFWGSEGRMQIGLAVTPLNKKLMFFSGDWDFGERERLLLNLLRPHLIALEAAARQRRLAAALLLEQEGAGLVVLGSSDKVEFTTPAAERLLARYFGGTFDGGLPEPVRGWLHHDSQRLNGNGLPPPAPAPLRIERGERRLTIRRAGRTLLLDEEIATLTRREREIIDQLAEGRSNAEIADGLTIAPATVRKHLEHIYAKLGVGTRTAAIAATRPEIERPSPSRSSVIPASADHAG
jgi:DNA-binding CsgD family transcriptional regulator